jgi:hypothetical protein
MRTEMSHPAVQAPHHLESAPTEGYELGFGPPAQIPVDLD